MTERQIKKAIKALINTNLMVVNKGSKQYPVYIVGGTADLERELVNLFCQLKATSKDQSKLIVGDPNAA